MAALQAYEEEVYSKLRPMIGQMIASIEEIEEGLPGKSGAVLAIKQWSIQSILRDTKLLLAKLTKGYDAQADLLLTFQKLDEAFTTLINVYDRIDNYTDQEKLGDYIACIGSSDVNSIQVNDLELQSALNNLDVLITSNVLLGQYKSATDGFTQTVFPFITSYSGHYHLPSDLQLDNDTANLVIATTARLRDLSHKLIEYNTTLINGDDKYIYSTVFDPRFQSSSAFFEWHWEDYRQDITELFDGKRISLRADVRRAPPANAIKFNVIELLFRAPDVGHQKQMDDLLLNFDIVLTHLGNSYYRCGPEYYVIHSPSQMISYSFEKHSGGPIRRNAVYDKLMGGNLMLSPYAMWTIQLKNASRDKHIFDKLALLANRVDLALMGRGQYVHVDAPVCDISLRDYYQVDETIAINY